jgi:hypothetical protein
MSKIRNNIVDAEWSFCLGCLREARALVLRDSESFHQAAMTLERIGQTLCGKIKNGLGYYKNELLELAQISEPNEPSEAKRLFDTVREARNMAVHEGAWARHLNSRLVDLFIILEQAITSKMKQAQDIMVRDPITAEPWQLIAHVRQAMLANSFSTLPVKLDQGWHIITDVMIMHYLRAAPDRMTHRNRLSTQLQDAIDNQEISPEKAICIPPSEKINDLFSTMKTSPKLVTEDGSKESRLIGLLSPFDLL